MKTSALLVLIILATGLSGLAQSGLSQYDTSRGVKRLEIKKSTKSLSAGLNSLKQEEQQKFIVQKILKEKGLIRGGGDAGGGNLLDGRPIENFAVDISRTPEMIQAIKVADLIGDVDFERLNKITKSIVEKKTWYLIPIDLPDLSEDQIGTPFASTQGALQDFEEIWIDQKRYEKMNFKEKVTLLVHEIYMGIKIFKSESFYKQCAWAEPFNKDCLHYQNYKSRKSLLVTPSDYQDIRKLVAQVSNNYEKLAAATYRDELVRKISTLVFENGGFDSYFVIPSRSPIALRDFTGRDILNSIRNQASVRGFPLFCNHKVIEDLGNHQYRMKAQLRAEMKHSIQGENVMFEVKATEIKTDKIILHNDYNFSVDSQHTNSLTLGSELNQLAYHFQTFIGVESKVTSDRNIGMISIGLTPSLNVRSLTFATFNSSKAEGISFYDGKHVIKCLEKEESICIGTDCVEFN